MLGLKLGERRLRKRFEVGELRVLAPPLLWLEVLTIAARHWRWTEDQLERLATSLPELGFELLEPEPPMSPAGRPVASPPTSRSPRTPVSN